MQDILTAISTVGFPIVMCILMFYMNEKQDLRHKDEVDKITEALNNNTLVITELKDKISNINEKVG